MADKLKRKNQLRTLRCVKCALAVYLCAENLGRLTEKDRKASLKGQMVDILGFAD